LVQFLEQAAEVLVGELKEEQEGAGLPVGGLRIEEEHLPAGDEDGTLLDQGGDILVEVGEEVVVEGLVDGVEATAEEEAAVVAAAGEHRRRVGRQVLPAGMVGELPEDGVEEETRVGNGSTRVDF